MTGSGGEVGATGESSVLLTLRRLFASHWFFVAVALLLVLVTASDVVEVLGARPAQVIRRNSEGIAMVLVAWYWLLFAGGRDLAGHGGSRSPVRVGGQLVWLVGWGSAAVVLQGVALGWIDIELPGRLVTLGEAAAAVAVINLYLALTRRLLLGGDGREPGVVPAAGVRAGLFVLLLVTVVGVHLAGPSVVPAAVDDLVRLNVEFVAGVLLLLLVVDVVANPPTTTTRVVWWCVAMIVVPVVVALGDGGGLPAGLADWTSRATEAFLAAAVVAAWFHNWQRLRAEEP